MSDVANALIEDRDFITDFDHAASRAHLFAGCAMFVKAIASNAWA